MGFCCLGEQGVRHGNLIVGCLRRSNRPRTSSRQPSRSSSKKALARTTRVGTGRPQADLSSNSARTQLELA